MFFTLPYTFLCKFIMLNDEVTKNIFSIYQVQRKQLNHRREKIGGDVGEVDRKNFFNDDDGPIDLGDLDDGEEVKKEFKDKKPKIIYKGDNPFEPTRKKKKV